jgi:NAD(P)-dependent dehydrogenase (short-subunit alcohol dehydrogenase family)
MKKVMLITGASRGIGAEVARHAARAGYQVGVNYHRSREEAHALIDEIRAARGSAIAIHADVGQRDQVMRMFGEIDKAYGRLDVLVNNAGVLANFRVDESNETNVTAVFRANVFSMYFCSREGVRRMSTRYGNRGGVIVNMSSVASRLGGLAGGAAYAASKGAIDTFTLALAKEVGPEGVRVNALRPGLIETDIHNVHGGVDRMQALAKSVVPLGRSGTAAEVAETVMWLASDAASYVHGAIIDVSGGR